MDMQVDPDFTYLNDNAVDISLKAHNIEIYFSCKKRNLI